MSKVNTAACRKIEMMYYLSRTHAMTHAELMKLMGLGKSSVWNYLSELVQEKKVRARYTMPKQNSKKPVTYYCLRKPK
jgi:predicted transcriptional regulator